MAGYETQISPQGIEDLVALIRSWQTETRSHPVGDITIDFENMILNPAGPEPDFEEGERFVGVDKVNEAMELGARMALLDARPSSDYLLEHITGAVSLPFYSAEDYVDELPKDVWLVVYCGCPHAESGQVADILEAAGFTTVKVLDEGFYEWKARGYPITTGATN